MKRFFAAAILLLAVSAFAQEKILNGQEGHGVGGSLTDGDTPTPDGNDVDDSSCDFGPDENSKAIQAWMGTSPERKDFVEKWLEQRGFTKNVSLFVNCNRRDYKALRELSRCSIGLK